jgi:hypothetical protein
MRREKGVVWRDAEEMFATHPPQRRLHSKLFMGMPAKEVRPGVRSKVPRSCVFNTLQTQGYEHG